MRKSLLLFVMTLLLCGNAHAIKDSNGKESTQYILDYKTGEKKYFECETLDQLHTIADKELRQNRTVSVDETGTTVEWTIENACFYNYVYPGGAYSEVMDDRFYWSVKSGMCPSSYYVCPDGSMEPDFESYMIPGSRNTYKLINNASLEDVEISVISIETTDIGDCQLMEWMQDKWDGKPRKMKDSQENGFHPQDLFNIVIYPEAFQKENFFFIESLFGQYDPTSWNLKAVTRIKYHIANAVPNNYKQPESGLFDEDRVWTYNSSHFVSPLAYEVKMRFDGTTEYEGRTYHKFTNSSYYCTTEEKELTPCEPILVRAHHGKVFARLPEGVYVAPTECLQYDAGTGFSEEVQLYDFRCPVGETFSSIDNRGKKMNLRVTGEETVEIGGQQLRKMRVKLVYDEADDIGGEWDIVENIGIVSENGFFAFFNTALVSGYADPTYMVGCAQNIDLSRYGTSDGRALYRPYVRPLLSYDKMWEYFGYEIDNNHSDVYPEGKTDCRLSRYVTGQNKTVGDRIYTELILDGVTSWVIPYPTYNFTDPGTGAETENAGNCAALLREEGGKVWMLLQGETVQYTAVPYKEVWTRPVTENEEVLLYDFNAGQGTVVDGWFNNVLAPAVVRYVDDLTNTGGTELWKFNLVNDRPDPSWSVENGPAVYIDVNYVEGVGNIGEGNLTELWSKSPYDPVPTCICGSGEFFNNLYDRQGNLLQGGRGIKAPETQGVGGVTDENGGDGARYDLFGRRIREAARGQVYILNGRKYVGK